VDFATLVDRDHADLDIGLMALLDTPTTELPSLVEAVRLTLAVHVAAERRVVDRLIDHSNLPPLLSARISITWMEHAAQHRAAERLAVIEPGSADWHRHVIALRGMLGEHASESRRDRDLCSHLTSAAYERLAGAYATERLRVLASTSPMQLARTLTAGS
jgi:hypothetical protein